MAELRYVTGDATDPQGEGIKVIPHVCNDERRWGKGFVLAVSKKWAQPEETYRHSPRLDLGQNHYVPVEDDIVVVNMIAQHSVGAQIAQNVSYPGLRRPPIRYGALAQCLNQVAGYVIARSVPQRPPMTVHAPRFGAGLAGADWPTIEALILECLVDQGVDVTIYDLA